MSFSCICYVVLSTACIQSLYAFCSSHSNCPGQFCMETGQWDYCQDCSQCHNCWDGVGNNCGSCGAATSGAACVPTSSPTPSPTPSPTLNPTTSPTPSPTLNPTPTPTNNPTPFPTIFPTLIPTITPTYNPTYNPTITPSINPSKYPTKTPSNIPTFNPSFYPTLSPIHTISPTITSSIKPSFQETHSNKVTIEQDKHVSLTAPTKRNIVYLMTSAVVTLLCCVLCILCFTWIKIKKRERLKRKMKQSQSMSKQVEMDAINNISNDTHKKTHLKKTERQQNGLMFAESINQHVIISSVSMDFDNVNGNDKDTGTDEGTNEDDDDTGTEEGIADDEFVVGSNNTIGNDKNNDNEYIITNDKNTIDENGKGNMEIKNDEFVVMGDDETMGVVFT